MVSSTAFIHISDRMSRARGGTQHDEASQDVNKAINVPTETLYIEPNTIVFRHVRVAHPWI